MVEKHKWTDDFGREVVARFDRGEFEWVTCWVSHADEFRTFVAGPAVLYGSTALATFTEEEQKIIFDMAMDEASDMSSRERAHEMIDELTAEDMRQWLTDATEDDLGDDPLGDWHGRNE